jgi:plasmid stability protein
MAQVIVRNLDEDVKVRLQARALQHGHSMEEEIRTILRDAVTGDDATPPPLGTQIAGLFRGLGLDEAIPEQRGAARPAHFDE